jgi:hypothetical protein
MALQLESLTEQVEAILHRACRSSGLSRRFGCLRRQYSRVEQRIDIASRKQDHGRSVSARFASQSRRKRHRSAGSTTNVVTAAKAIAAATSSPSPEFPRAASAQRMVSGETRFVWSASQRSAGRRPRREDVCRLQGRAMSSQPCGSRSRSPPSGSAERDPGESPPPPQQTGLVREPFPAAPYFDATLPALR